MIQMNNPGGKYEMIRTLVVYSSKYGSTRDAAKIIALINGPAIYCSVDEFKPEYREFDFICYWDHPSIEEKLEPSIIEFADKNRDWLKDKACITLLHMSG